MNVIDTHETPARYNYFRRIRRRFYKGQTKRGKNQKLRRSRKKTASCRRFTVFSARNPHRVLRATKRERTDSRILSTAAATRGARKINRSSNFIKRSEASEKKTILRLQRAIIFACPHPENVFRFIREDGKNRLEIIVNASETDYVLPPHSADLLSGKETEKVESRSAVVLK